MLDVPSGKSTISQDKTPRASVLPVLRTQRNRGVQFTKKETPQRLKPALASGGRESMQLCSRLEDRLPVGVKHLRAVPCVQGTWEKHAKREGKLLRK